MASESPEIVSVELLAPSGWKKMVSFFFFFPLSYVYILSSVSEEEKRGFFFNGLVAEIVVELNGLSF